jgi:hypothetical protein
MAQFDPLGRHTQQKNGSCTSFIPLPARCPYQSVDFNDITNLIFFTRFVLFDSSIKFDFESHAMRRSNLS